MEEPIVYINDTTGKLILYKSVLDAETAEGYFVRLNEETPWETEKLVMMGKQLELKRKVAAYGNDGKSLKYAGKTQKSVIWGEAIRELKELVEQLVGQTVDYAFMNYYANGEDKLGFHADNEKEHDPDAFIISLSFGATRDMQFKAKDITQCAPIFKDNGNLLTIPLEAGDLLLMDFTLQKFYKHAIPQRKRIKTPRINVTFRKFKK